MTMNDQQIRKYFIDGVEEAYSLIADPDLEAPERSFDRWLAEHDRRIKTEARLRAHGGTIIHFPPFQAFGRLKPDKWLLIKTLEEAAELVEAGKDHIRHLDDEQSGETYTGMLDELADVLQTVANLCDAFGVSRDDLGQAAVRCLRRNEERGRI